MPVLARPPAGAHANVVAGIRFDSSEPGGIMADIPAYGTAVTVEPVAAMTPGTIPGLYVSRGVHA
jgi:hypothetical protein